MSQVSSIILLSAEMQGRPEEGIWSLESDRHAFKSLLGSVGQNMAPQNLSKLNGKMGIIVICLMGYLL